MRKYGRDKKAISFNIGRNKFEGIGIQQGMTRPNQNMASNKTTKTDTDFVQARDIKQQLSLLT